MITPLDLALASICLASVIALIIVLVALVRKTVGKPLDGVAREEFRLGREESGRTLRELREELGNTLTKGNSAVSGALTATLTEMAKLQQGQLETVARQIGELTQANQSAIDRVKDSIDGRLKQIQENNETKLEDMRKTVDEKLHGTLERRLGESFKLVSERLEAVQRGLGEMQGLATGVGDLKRVLTNVKARGTWAEVQLGELLDQILTKSQYQKNVKVKESSRESVEFAVRLPGPKDDPCSQVWLPIDSKFPQEDYNRLQEAADRADPQAVQTALDGLLRAVRQSARDIHDKYIDPPNTTDFAIMFLVSRLRDSLRKSFDLLED